MDISKLKDMKMGELTSYARDLGINGLSGLRKQDLIFKVLQAKAEKAGLMFGEGTLEILSEIGVYFPSQKALEIFSDHGANVDWETKIVRIPPDLVRNALATAPRSFVLGGREERFDLTLDGSASYLATDGCGVHVIDPETREKRASRKSDVAMMARISDALPVVSFAFGRWATVGRFATFRNV